MASKATESRASPINSQARAVSRAVASKVVSRAAAKASRGSRAANASNRDAGLGVFWRRGPRDSAGAEAVKANSQAARVERATHTVALSPSKWCCRSLYDLSGTHWVLVLSYL